MLKCHYAQVGALPLLSLWIQACAEQLYQNSCITFFKDGGEMNFTTITTAFFNEIFLALTLTTCILPSGAT